VIVVHSGEECRRALSGIRERNALGFVPTMGALHEGHLSLIRRSARENPFTVISVYVNPTQFGPQEDFSSYPRTLERDRQLAEEAGANLFWTPTDQDIYPGTPSTFIEETVVSRPLCGEFRPGHFRGVTTVVYRLLRVVAPDRIYLGRKDAQQLRVLEKMIEDLDLGVKVVGCPTVREKDGLAMSSRNAYLSPSERAVAPALYAALSEAEEAFLRGIDAPEALVETVTRRLNVHPEIRVQYVDLRRWRDFERPGKVDEPSVLAAALFLGKTRLIDNLILEPRKTSSV
jgi:pantoate--beta-alanine ligase